MDRIDGLILVGYFLISLILGLFFYRKHDQRENYLLAGHSMSWLPIGLSIMVTAFSAINITAFSGEVFGNGLYVLMSVPVFYLVSIPVKKVVIPFFHQLNITSAYEYLEIRFQRRVRTLAAIMFIIWRMLWVGTVVYVPGRILSQISGISLNTLVILIGSIATLYTFLGGIRAVIWTDVLQFFVMISGLAATVVYVILFIPKGLSGIGETVAAGGLLRPFHPFDPGIFSLDPRIRISFWSALVGTFIAFLTRYSADQMVVQRYLTAKNLSHVQKGFTLNIIAAIISILMLAFLGLAIYAYFIQQGITVRTNILPIRYFTRFLMNLPAGIKGLLVTTILAASMSSFDSGIHSCSTVFSTDFPDSAPLKRISPQLLVLIIGLLIIIVAINMQHFGSIFEIANKVVNGFGSPLLALFIAGKYIRRCNAAGAFWGGLAGLIFSSMTILLIHNLALHYYAVINFGATLGFICFFSLTSNRTRFSSSNKYTI